MKQLINDILSVDVPCCLTTITNDDETCMALQIPYGELHDLLYSGSKLLYIFHTIGDYCVCALSDIAHPTPSMAVLTKDNVIMYIKRHYNKNDNRLV